MLGYVVSNSRQNKKEKIICALLLFCLCITPNSVLAMEENGSAMDWSISTNEKKSPEEIERERWSYVFANEITQAKSDASAVAAAGETMALINNKLIVPIIDKYPNYKFYTITLMELFALLFL